MASLPALAQSAARQMVRRATSGERHALSPAAVRVERGRDRKHGGEQTAITVWFGEGPALPGAGTPSRNPWRTLAGLGVTLAGAAALAAATTVVADREERRRIQAARPVSLPEPSAD